MIYFATKVSLFLKIYGNKLCTNQQYTIEIILLERQEIGFIVRMRRTFLPYTLENKRTLFGYLGALDIYTGTQSFIKISFSIDLKTFSVQTFTNFLKKGVFLFNLIGEEDQFITHCLIS